jgi:three-Cys-motif partner protein
VKKARSSKKSGDQGNEQSLTRPLFPGLEPEIGRGIRTYKRFEFPIWTENKAHFIQQYLRYFVQITKHGAYIDVFAGPQSFAHLDAWTAALVLSSEPKWLRQFYLCELTQRGVKALEGLVASQPETVDKKGRRIQRRVEILAGDFNIKVDEILKPERITDKEAAFC